METDILNYFKKCKTYEPKGQSVEMLVTLSP